MIKGKNIRALKAAFPDSLPVMAGYLVLGMGFGILLGAKGYSCWWALLMSVVIFAGAMQYVGVNLLASGASVVATLLMTLMVNARHLFYGISLIDTYKNMGPKRWYAAFGLTDETYSLVCIERELPEGTDRGWYIFFLTLLNQCYWIVGGFIGALIGSNVAFNSAGIDFSMTALFVAIFVEQWEKTKQHLPALLGIAVSIVCILIFGADNFLIPAMIGICVGLFLMRNKLKGVESND